MKKLISLKDIEDVISLGKDYILIDGTEIITPAAMDFAKSKKINFLIKDKEIPEEINKGSKSNQSIVESKLEGLDNDMFMRLCKTMIEKGFLNEIMTMLRSSNSKFISEKHKNGFEIIKGNSVKMDVFDTGNKNDTAYYQELIGKEKSKMSAGFLTIEDSNFEWELTYEEIDYVIEGSITIEIDGIKYTANEGDVIFIPSGSKVVWIAKEKVKLFYSTYPSNWADSL